MTAFESEPDRAGGDARGKELCTRLKGLEHAMRTPVGTLAASLEVLSAAKDRQTTERVIQTMSRQIRLLTSQLEQLHDLGADLAAAGKGPS